MTRKRTATITFVAAGNRRRRPRRSSQSNLFGVAAHDEQRARELAADLATLVRAGLIVPIPDRVAADADTLRFGITDQEEAVDG